MRRSRFGATAIEGRRHQPRDLPQLIPESHRNGRESMSCCRIAVELLSLFKWLRFRRLGAAMVDIDDIFAPCSSFGALNGAVGPFWVGNHKGLGKNVRFVIPMGCEC